LRSKIGNIKCGNDGMEECLENGENEPNWEEAVVNIYIQ
jgi:hypothetical protein